MIEASLDGWSSMITMSEASMAASEPRPPMATPASARARTGASFIPSPTNIRLPRPDLLLMMFSAQVTLSTGISSAWY
jgi:hypothetical protein